MKAVLGYMYKVACYVLTVVHETGYVPLQESAGKKIG
jgi:hypothetical protein